MSKHRGKGAIGCSMQIVSTTKKRKLPPWMKKSYEDRVFARDASSAKRLKRLQDAGKIVTLAPAIKTHSCGAQTVLEAQFYLIAGKRGQYESFCPACQVFAAG